MKLLRAVNVRHVVNSLKMFVWMGGDSDDKDNDGVTHTGGSTNQGTRVLAIASLSCFTRDRFLTWTKSLYNLCMA